MEIKGTFRIEQVDETIVLTPMMDLGEFEYAHIERDGRSVLERLAAARANALWSTATRWSITARRPWGSSSAFGNASECRKGTWRSATYHPTNGTSWR